MKNSYTSSTVLLTNGIGASSSAATLAFISRITFVVELEDIATHDIPKSTVALINSVPYCRYELVFVVRVILFLGKAHASRNFCEIKQRIILFLFVKNKVWFLVACFLV